MLKTCKMLASLCCCLIILVSDVIGQTSFLDGFVGPFRIFRNIVGRTSNAVLMNNVNQNLLRSQNKLQPIFNRTFPCDISYTRSKNRPTSVHKLRPGDIDVIGAMGDSLTAGFGVFATSALHLVYESRGASFIAGGDESWKTYLTIANIFKEFNPNLYGYSTGHSITIAPQSRFNVAEAAAISDNLPYMVKVLVERIKSDPRVNVKRDWKFINILIGSNDVCSEMCYYKKYDYSLKKHKNEMLYVLRYLRDNLPRTLVNLVPPLSPFLLKKMHNKPFICQLIQDVFCPCLYGFLPQNEISSYMKVFYRWQEIDVDVGNLDEFQRDDFSVVVQPFSINLTGPMKNGDVDLSFFSVDCFHLSQKGYAAVVNVIWNMILTPVGRKKREINYKVMDEFICPTKENPYIFTKMNSINV